MSCCVNPPPPHFLLHHNSVACRHLHEDYTLDECYKFTLGCTNVGCPTCYQTWHFFNNFTTGWRTTAPCRNNWAHYRRTLQTHSSSFLTQRTYSCSNFVAISSMLGSVVSGKHCIIFLFWQY